MEHDTQNVKRPQPLTNRLWLNLWTLQRCLPVLMLGQSNITVRWRSETLLCAPRSPSSEEIWAGARLGRWDAGQSRSLRIRDRLRPRRSTLTLSSKYCMNYMCWVSCSELTTADKDRCSSSCRDLLNLALREAASRCSTGSSGESTEVKTPQREAGTVIRGEAVRRLNTGC